MQYKKKVYLFLIKVFLSPLFASVPGFFLTWSYPENIEKIEYYNLDKLVEVKKISWQSTNELIIENIDPENDETIYLEKNI